MSLLAIPFPVIDPVAIEIGPVAVRWYGLAYMFGLLLGWLYARSLLRNQALWRPDQRLEPDLADDLLLWATLGVVVGGRLGYVLFYEPGRFGAHPEDIIKLWNGGMSFHGGLIGVCLAVYLFARCKGLPVMSVADMAAAVVPIGLLFGRLANFVNGELFGRVSEVPWAMVFPEGGLQPRHPSQLYEAALEGLLLFLVCRYFTHRRRALETPGVVSGVFFIGYGVARSSAEYFRQFDPDHAFSTGLLTPGIVYSLPMIVIGGYMIRSANQKRAATLET